MLPAISALAAASLPTLQPTPPHNPGDVHIRERTVLPDGTHFSVNGSLFLEEGGTLELKNGVVEVLNTFDRQFNIYWRGGTLNTTNTTVGGHLACGTATAGGRARRLIPGAPPPPPTCVCYHANHYLNLGAWVSNGDTVRCSYGVLMGGGGATLNAVGLSPGPSPDSIILGATSTANVSLRDSRFSLLLGLGVSPGVTTRLDLPAGVPLTETVRSPSGDGWTVTLDNTTCTHWFVQLGTVGHLTAGGGAPSRFEFSGRTTAFNLHLATRGVNGTFPVRMSLSPPVAVGNVVLASADDASPVPLSAWELYATSLDASEVLHLTGVGQGGEQMQFGPGTLRVSGVSAATSSVSCTTCNANGDGGTLIVDSATVGHLGGLLTAQVSAVGGSRFVATSVTLNDVNLIAQGKGHAGNPSSIDVSVCTERGHVRTVIQDPGCPISVRCSGAANGGLANASRGGGA